MGIVRNCIDIIGITPESELPNKINGQYIEASETENLFIGNNIKIKNIYQIIIDKSIKETRVINTPINRIIVIDGYKKLKIAYYDSNNNMGILELKTPYNIFFDIENSKIQIEKINIYIADAYFELINRKVLYCHIIYIVDIHYLGDEKRIYEKDNINKYTENKYLKNLYTSSINNKKQLLQEEIIDEMTISEYNKDKFQEVINVEPTEKNYLIDIDAEYL